MIASAPHIYTISRKNPELEYLLLGDLREALEEPLGLQSSQWILAILDTVLAGHTRIRPPVYLPIERNQIAVRSKSSESRSLIEKLRRLRDRIAHRSVNLNLIDDLREELREVMYDRLSCAACFLDD